MRAYVIGEVKAPPGEVFEFLAEPVNLAAWVTGIGEGRREAERPLELGARFVTVYEFPGEHQDLTQEVTVFEPPSRLAWRTVSGPYPVGFDLKITAQGSGTRLRYEQEAVPDNLKARIAYFLFASIMRLAVRRRLQIDLERLAAAIEGGPPDEPLEQSERVRARRAHRRNGRPVAGHGAIAADLMEPPTPAAARFRARSARTHRRGGGRRR